MPSPPEYLPTFWLYMQSIMLVISKKIYKKLSVKQECTVDEECYCVGIWIYMNLLLVKNYHNFEMEYAMSLQQVSTCCLDKDLQFGT